MLLREGDRMKSGRKDMMRGRGLGMWIRCIALVFMASGISSERRFAWNTL